MGHIHVFVQVKIDYFMYFGHVHHCCTLFHCTAVVKQLSVLPFNIGCNLVHILCQRETP